MSNDRIGPTAGTDLAPDGKTTATAREDPRLTRLRAAVGGLRRELAGYRARLSDRGVAEDELALLDAQAASGDPCVARLRGSLLVVAGALGSVSALALPLAEVRRAIDLFGPTGPTGAP